MGNGLGKEARNCNLDALRMLACFAVVGLHALYKEDYPLGALIYYLCGFAVPAFFMASGYILIQRNEITYKYVLRKIGSILVISVLWYSIIFVAKFTRGGYTTNIITGYFAGYAKTLLNKDTCWHFWYFGSLMIIYLLLPFLNRLCKDNHRLLLIWMLCLVVSVGIQMASYFSGRPVQESIVQTLRLWTWIQYFLMGGVIARYKIESKPKLMKWLTIVVTALCTIWQLFAGRGLLQNIYAEYFYDDLLFIGWCYLLFNAILQMDFTQRSKGVIRQIAPLTLGIYIIHPLLIGAIKHVITIDNVPISIVLFFGVSLMSAIVVKCLQRMRLKAFIELM